MKSIYLTIGLFVIISFYCCGTTAPSSSQSRLPQTRQQAPAFETDEDLLKKITMLEKDLLEQPSNSQLLLQLASLHQEVHQQDQALAYMERLKEQGYTDDPRLYGSLARIYQNKNMFAKAIDSYQTFQSLLPKNSLTLAKIQKEIDQLKFVIRTLEEPDDIALRPLGPAVNTSNSEYLPQFTLDNRSFIFTRRFFDQEDLFLATKTEKGYDVEAIDEVNTLLNEGAHTISSDGSLLIFTHCNKKTGYGSCDLYRSTRQSGDSWSKPTNMGRNINSEHWDAQPSLSADGRTLYFASNRPGGQGGTDIWACRLLKDGRWSKPVNIGANVNTAEADESPFIHADGQTLYYRSRGQIGMGGFDLYRSTLTDNQWDLPIHLGSPINTTGEDGALVVSLDGTKGYYATDKYKGQRYDHLDLIEFDLPMKYRPSPMTFIRGRIIDEETQLPLEASLEVSYLDDSNYSTVYHANANGEFLAAIPIGRPTLLHISHEGYTFYSDHIYYEDVRYSVDPYLLDISISKIDAMIEADTEAAPIILKNIFFVSGSAELMPNSKREIDLLHDLLLERDDVKIDIFGHTDNVGTGDDNMTLSQQRAEAVQLVLINRGIDPKRITATGRGSLMPIDTNDTKEGRANNRRTEILIRS